MSDQPVSTPYHCERCNDFETIGQIRGLLEAWIDFGGTTCPQWGNLNNTQIYRLKVLAQLISPATLASEEMYPSDRKILGLVFSLAYKDTVIEKL